ncbi:hypothetical protein NDU88_004666 [Pleurodeles waltl]|uniref:Uncharacterized protein n=1 Tax=Pleurodeles waltl TaxID=8319 RepID=A0AAV7SJG2_PLEWA|nr:hypothetical protein NDU88_004666 [Pleurodeles waltl]
MGFSPSFPHPRLPGSPYSKGWDRWGGGNRPTCDDSRLFLHSRYTAILVFYQSERRERLSFPLYCALWRLLRGTTAAVAHGVLLYAAAAAYCSLFPLKALWEEQGPYTSLCLRNDSAAPRGSLRHLTDAPELLQPTAAAAMLRSSSVSASRPHITSTRGCRNMGHTILYLAKLSTWNIWVACH